VEDVEFRLGRGYFARPLAQGCLALVLAVILYVADFHTPGLQFLAIFPLVFAAGSLAVCGWRGHLRTRLTAQGVEIRRFHRRLVPWEAIRDIETIGYDRVGDVPVASARTRIESPRGRGPRTVAAVQLVRTSGHRIRLPAPVVTNSQGDPHFNDKVQLIKARWQQAVTGTAGHLGHPASY
jgi:Bacterial PH domain